MGLANSWFNVVLERETQVASTSVVTRNLFVIHATQNLKQTGNIIDLIATTMAFKKSSSWERNRQKRQIPCVAVLHKHANFFLSFEKPGLTVYDVPSHVGL